MDKNQVNLAVFFTAGLLIGAGSTYLIVKKKYRLLAEEEIAEVKDVFQKISDEKVKQFREDWNPQNEDETFRTKFSEVVEGSPYLPTKETPEDVVTITEKDETTMVHPDLRAPRDPKEPYIITQEEFHTDMEDYSKFSIEYWEADDTLVDETEQIIDDVDYHVGTENLKSFGMDPEDPFTIYIRNEHLEVDYEVNRDMRSFHEVALGIKNWAGPTNKAKKMRGDEE